MITVGTPTTGTSNSTLSHTVAAGTKILVVGFIGIGGTNGGPNADWNGTPMTKAEGGASDATALYYLQNPETGTHDVTFSGIGASGADTFAVDLSGTLSTTRNPVGATDDHSTGPGGGTRTLTTVAGSVVFDVGICDVSSGSPTMGADQTEIFNRLQGSGDNYAVASYQTASDTSTDVSWTFSGDNWSGIAMEIKEGTDFVPQIQII